MAYIILSTIGFKQYNKLIFLPFAGGNKNSFLNFFSGDEVSVLEYPGRGQRIHENLITNIDLLVEDLILQLKEEIGLRKKYIIYGHSMGALVGYLVCKKIEKLGLKKPSRLVVSGKKAPKYQLEEVTFNISDDLFWKKAISLGGIPEEMNDYPDLIDFYIPILKSDFECVEKYQHLVTPKLSIPIDVFYGSDEDISEQEAKEWQMETYGKVTVTELKGNHFFIFHHKDFFREYFKNLQLNTTT